MNHANLQRPVSEERLMEGWICPAHSSYLIKHLKELGTGLVNGADDCPSSLSQRLHEGNNLEAGRAVQAAGRKETEPDGRALLDFGFMTILCSKTKTKRYRTWWARRRT